MFLVNHGDIRTEIAYSVILTEVVNDGYWNLTCKAKIRMNQWKSVHLYSIVGMGAGVKLKVKCGESMLSADEVT